MFCTRVRVQKMNIIIMIKKTIKSFISDKYVFWDEINEKKGKKRNSKNSLQYLTLYTEPTPTLPLPSCKTEKKLNQQTYKREE